MFNGAGFDASGVGRISGMCVTRRLLIMFAVGVVHRLAQEFGLCVGKLSGEMYLIHEM